MGRTKKEIEQKKEYDLDGFKFDKALYNSGTTYTDQISKPEDKVKKLEAKVKRLEMELEEARKELEEAKEK